MNEHNADLLNHIIRYCCEIRDARERFGDSIEALCSDVHYRNAVAMCILQIGELTGYLDDDFKTKYNAIPWQKIKGMRNITAHHYGKIDSDILFRTISVRIPELQCYCEEILEQHAKLVQRTDVSEAHEENHDT